MSETLIETNSGTDPSGKSGSVRRPRVVTARKKTTYAGRYDGCIRRRCTLTSLGPAVADAGHGTAAGEAPRFSTSEHRSLNQTNQLYRIRSHCTHSPRGRLALSLTLQVYDWTLGVAPPSAQPACAHCCHLPQRFSPHLFLAGKMTTNSFKNKNILFTILVFI